MISLQVLVALGVAVCSSCIHIALYELTAMCTQLSVFLIYQEHEVMECFNMFKYYFLVLGRRHENDDE